MMPFRFPRAKFADSIVFKDQLDHAVGEMLEVVSALDAGEGMLRVAEEMIDTIHALETGLRILNERYWVDIVDVTNYVEMKNKARGYYS